MRMVEAGAALCVPGNHDIKLVRKLRGRDVQITHGLARVARRSSSASRAEFDGARSREFLDGLVSHYVLDDGTARRRPRRHEGGDAGRGSGKVREFALYGETTGETDEFGLPVRCELGGRVPRPGDGRLRPHAGARAGVAEPHDQHRHRAACSAGG